MPPRIITSRTMASGGDADAPLIRSATANFRRAVVDMLVRREDKNCSPQPGVNLCEKPAVSSISMTWIVVGSVIGVLVLVTFVVLMVLHFRRKKQDKAEDMNDRFQMSDWGMDEGPSSRKPRMDNGSQDGSPHIQPRRSREPLQAGTEPKYHGGQSNGNGHLNPFDDAVSFRSGTRPSPP